MISDLNGVTLNGIKFTKPPLIKASQTQSKNGKSAKFLTSEQVTASIIDWRTSKILTPIKDQGNCGSCWAFATCAFFEAYMAQTNMLTQAVDLA